MEMKYPHWYPHEDRMDPCCDYMDKDMTCEEHKPYMMVDCCTDTFKDRILCLLGDEVLLSVDARICRRESFCGTLCYVGCDFIIVNTCFHGRSLSLHVPIKMIRFISPFKSGKRRIF